MKAEVRHYVRALVELIEDGADEKNIVNGLLATAQKNGHRYKLPVIAEELEKTLLKKEGKKLVTLETARPIDKNQETLLGSVIDGSNHKVTKINPGLIAGLRITVDGERELDLSLTRIIKSLFQNV